jgi:hypothetical protein
VRQTRFSGQLLGAANRVIRQINRVVILCKVVLGQTALEIAGTTSERERVFDGQSIFQILIQEILKAIEITIAGDFPIDPFLHQRMLQPMTAFARNPDVCIAPDLFYSSKLVAKKDSHKFRNPKSEF